MLLRLWIVSGPGVARAWAGVEALNGAYDLRALCSPPNTPADGRWTKAGRTLSYRFAPDEERWKTGWFGLPGASDMREPDAERTWVLGAPAWRLCTEFERFIAEVGIGIADILALIPPRVWACQCASCHEVSLPCLPRETVAPRKGARPAPLRCADGVLFANRLELARRAVQQFLVADP